MKRLPLPLYIAIAVLASCSSKKTPGPLPPSEALASFRLSEEFHLEIFAAEPDVVDPVDMAFDESGRAYVAEMLDLPDDPPPGKPARGRIRLLEDTDGDGRADKSVIFAENTLHASGLMPWDGGLIVPASPEILYFKDTNGDGKADVRQVWFTGFYHGNPEAQITNPRLGVDNWIYFSNTGNEGLIRSPRHPNHPPVQVRGFDFRFHPTRGVFEPVSGNAQYGATFDDWGNRFISQNTTHLRHVVLPRPYLARAPLLEVPSAVHDVYGDHHRKMYPVSQPQEWRVVRTRLRQQRYDELKTGRVEHAAGYLTGATGGTLYRGDAWPESYKGSIFTGDVSGNLVRRDVLTPDGVTFKARPARDGVEFLASTDPWFRPANFAHGPDGNLYLMDMQREFIETPLSIPDELRKKMNFYSGDAVGRIYRIASNQPVRKRNLRVNLGALPAAELVGLLAHGNGWHRETAHRLLLERRDKSDAPRLRQSALESPSPQARLRALYLLEALDSLNAAVVEAALRDPRAEIREHAIALAERFPRLEKQIVSLAADPSPRVQMQAAFTLGGFSSPPARAAMVSIAARNPGDRWIRTALLSSNAAAPLPFFRTVLAASAEAAGEMAGATGSLIGARNNPSEMQAFVATLKQTRNPENGLAGLARGLRLAGIRSLKAPGMEAALAPYLDSGMDAAWEVARYFELRELITRASRDALNAALPLKKRSLALTALRGADAGKALPLLDQALASNPPTDVQTAAILSISSFDGPRVPALLLRHWKSYSPEARGKAVGALLAQKDRVPALLDALDAGEIELSALETAARNRLVEINDAALASRIRKIFQTPGGRAAVVAAYRDVLDLKGNLERGRQTFEDACAKCHVPRRQGGRVGPDLAGINMKTRHELLAAILDPSAAIEPRFVNYLVTTRDGRMYDGLLASETAGAITLRGGSEEDVTLARARIAEIRSSAISLMPEDFEKTLSRQALSDLIAYLQGGL